MFDWSIFDFPNTGKEQAVSHADIADVHMEFVRRKSA